MDFHAACRDCRPGYLMQTDANISYTGISDVHERLFRNDKSPFCCCTSGSLPGTLLL